MKKQELAIGTVNKFYLSFCLLFCLSTFSVFSQESVVKINHEGKEFTQLKHAWTSQWITHPTESTLDARKFLFRRTFDLKAMPEKFIVHLSADNRYRLFVNGKYIISGPSSSDINNYRYETIDIANELIVGKNIIAAEVVNFGEYRKASSMTFQTAFILQGEKSNPVDLNTGKASKWKVINDEGFKSIPFVSDSLRGYYAAGPGEKLISKKHQWGWKEIDYDDVNWLEPKLATVEFAVGRGFLYGSTWYLVPRSIPFLEESVQRFNKIARSVGIDANDDFIKGKGSITIPPNKKVSLLLDQSHHTIGHPELKYSKGKESRIKVTYSEAMYDKDWKKGNRNEVKGKHILGYYDIIEPDGGMNREFKPFGQKTYRFVQLDIETGEEALLIDDFYGVYTAYPFKENAKFKTDNEVLTQIWDASWLTLRNSAVESFIDPYYEQLQYVGDTRIEAIVSISVDGDDRLMRKAIEMFDNSRLPNGLTQSRYPSYIVQVIPTYSLLWVNMLHDYHMYKNDDEFVRKFIPGMKNVMDWWTAKVDKNDMPTNMEWWNFTDWAQGYPNGIPPGADDGYSASVALQFVKTLQNAARIFSDLGYNEEAEKYLELEKRIRQSVVKNCFVKEKGMFAETPNKKQFSQHTNIMAILTDAIPKEDQKALMHNILDDKDLIQTTIYYKFYLFEALQKSGLGNLYSSLLQNWTNQLDQGLTTFAETDINPRSECHAWSASPNYHFLKVVAGIYPLSKNFEEIAIAPHFGDLKGFEAVMPHPNGDIVVNLKKKGNKVKGEIVLPKGTTGIFKFNNREIKLTEGKQIIKQ
ncbi:alpha-L-rhamnosidase [Aureibaculum algae]|uniref:Alpha-L-rhamnosidase n=1 Tax=Aureibaculum algae TaxID=2584122 RepID=A0A5B7TLQ6_9FLAO|nr:alpha-L-rhamnosidase C-terminal domain-containing protein [Aureibaculum algae]QCX37669.1 alpha-L-rhamnosidase [Aureibaculum algae]